MTDFRLKCRSCSFKGKTFVAPISQWHLHNKRSHATDRLKCPKCPFLFETYSLRNQHNKEDHKVIICLECDRLGQTEKYIPESDMDSHYRQQHKHLKVKCLSCLNRFHGTKQLDEHKTLWHHFNPAPPSIVCETCSAQFDNKKDMKLHTTKQHPNKPFVCSNCFIGFGSRGARDTHQRSCKTKYKK